MRKVDYDKIWEVYEIRKDPKNRNRAERRAISRHLDKYLKKLGKPEDFPWESLSKLEQDKFIYIEIREFMKNHYVPDPAWEDIEKKINRYIHNTPLGVEERIQTSNESKNNLYRNHRVTTHSDADKMDAYYALRNDIQANAGIPMPTYKEFEKRLSLNTVCPEEAGGKRKTKKQPIRAYDYIMSDAEIRLDPMLTMGVYVRIILKVLEEELDLKVDYNMIDQCLLCREEFYEYCRHKGYERNDDWDFPMEYDEKLEMTEEEYEELKERYAEYLFYKKKLNELKPLYQYKKKDDSNPR